MYVQKFKKYFCLQTDALFTILPFTKFMSFLYVDRERERDCEILCVLTNSKSTFIKKAASLLITIFCDPIISFVILASCLEVEQ